MSKTREIPRARWALGLSVREASRATGVSTGVVSKTSSRASTAGLTWAAVEALSESELERRLYGEPAPAQSDRAEPDPVWMHRELRRKGVTLELLHLEYLSEHPTGFRYSAFLRSVSAVAEPSERGDAASASRGREVLRRLLRLAPGGLRSGDGRARGSGAICRRARASNLTFAVATLTQRATDFVAAHVKAFEYFGGAAKLTVPDQLRSAVTVPGRYEPTIHRTYSDLGRHYDTAIVRKRTRRST